MLEGIVPQGGVPPETLTKPRVLNPKPQNPTKILSHRRGPSEILSKPEISETQDPPNVA
jgi:hypothetical protein